MDDIEVLRTGSHVIFNRPGQGFFSIVDESRLTRPMGNTIFRIMYYMCIPFCDEETQRQGTTVIHVGTWIHTLLLLLLSFEQVRSSVSACSE